MDGIPVRILRGIFFCYHQLGRKSGDSGIPVQLYCVLPDDQKLTLEIARVIRLGFLQQNAFHNEDTCVPMEKQFNMMEIILYLYEKSKALVNRGMPVSVLKEDNIFERIISIKYDVPNNQPERFEQYRKDIDEFYDNVLKRNG